MKGARARKTGEKIYSEIEYLKQEKGQVPRENAQIHTYRQTDRQTDIFLSKGMTEEKTGFDVRSWVVRSTVVKVVKGASSAL